jgi:hypothetical protein
MPGAQTVTTTPASIQDLSSAVPVNETFSFEPQIQNRVQGNSTNGNPFAYEHATQIRPWLHYDGIPDTTITSAVSYIYYYTVSGTSYTKHLEWRFTTFGTLRQSLSGGPLYEQLRFELLNFRASNGRVTHISEWPHAEIHELLYTAPARHSIKAAYK